ncbi:hypothetical protein [Celeribacter sp.]|uniref:hypothetical protein n=1 Tax=Celeribacter sp. TaxID=1890673 RepID=UPI003A921603
MRQIRPVIAALFALLLIVTSQSMAVARGTMTDAAGEMVLCTGTGPVTVLYDENGEPLGPSHICPDCALSVIADVGQVFSLAAPLRHAEPLDAPATALARSGVDALPATARGPPVV